jgi:hypothetical protein
VTKLDHCFKLLTPARIKTTAEYFYSWISLSLRVKWRWGTYWVGSDRRAVRSHWGQWRGTYLLPNQTDFPKHFYFTWIRYGGRSPKPASPQTTLNPSDMNCLHDRVAFKENINVIKSMTITHTHTHLQITTFCIFIVLWQWQRKFPQSHKKHQHVTPTDFEPRQQHRYERRGTAVAQKYRMYLKCLVTSKILGQISRVIFFTLHTKKNSATLHVQKCPEMSVAAFTKLQKTNVCYIFPSVCLSAWNISARPRRSFVKLDIRGTFENLSRKFRSSYKIDKNNGILYMKTYLHSW